MKQTDRIPGRLGWQPAARFLPILVLALVWLGLTQGRIDAWLIGAPTVLLAFFLFVRVGAEKRQTLRLYALPGFFLWFLRHSLRGGIDVARRALLPSLPLKPGFVRYRLRLPAGSARVFLVNCLSLLPGTVSADLEGDELILHGLDLDQDLTGETRRAEARVAKLFGIEGVGVHE